SAGSHDPVDARHSVPDATRPSVGQIVEVPVHDSAVSHVPAAARHTCAPLSVAHTPSLAAPPATLHAWQSPVSLPPHAVLQQTPSAQLPLTQSMPTLHAAPSGLRE